MEDTTFDRDDPNREKKPDRSWVQDRIATFLPGNAVVDKSGPRYHFIDPIIIGLQPVSIMCGLFLTLTFGWAVAVTTLLRFVVY